MRRPEGIGFLGNTVANLLVGAAALGYAVVVPAVVVRRFGPDEYGLWYLAFQVAAYVVLLDLGSQYLVTNEAAGRAHGSRAARFATASVVVQSGLGLAVVVAAAAWARLAGQPQLARFMLVLGAAALVSLLASTVRAWFVGLQRAHVPAVWLVGARLAALAGLIAAVAGGASLVMLTVAVAVPQLAVHAALLLWARRPPSPWARPDGTDFRRLFRGTLPLALWTVCGILIGGVDIFVVRAVDPGEVGRYAIALPLLAVPIGVVTAAITAWMPRVAHSEAGAAGGGRLPTLTGTTVMTGALALGGIAFLGLADGLVRLWAGPGHWGHAAGYLQLLYLASCLRFVFLPWTILVLVRGEQGRITLAPLAEAVVNVVASVVLGLWLGAVGVALGTLVGALVATVLYLGWAVPRTDRSGITTPGLVSAAAAAWPTLAALLGVALLLAAGTPVSVRLAAAVVALAVDVGWLVGQRRRLLVPLVELSPS